MSLSALAWLFTAGALAHNVEEAVFLPAWSARAGRWQVPVGARAFAVAGTLLSVMLVALAVVSVAAGPGSVWAYLFAGYVLAMVANAFVPHLAGSVALKRYVPGTATALLFNIPLGALYLQKALAQRFVEWGTVVWAAPATALGILALIPILFAAGRWLLPDATPRGKGAT